MSMLGGSGRNRALPWQSAFAGTMRARGDQFLVLIALIAIWQACSLAFGAYWIGSPWGVLTRFTTGIFAGDLLRHTAYTLSEAVAGFLIGALPAGQWRVGDVLKDVIRQRVGGEQRAEEQSEPSAASHMPSALARCGQTSLEVNSVTGHLSTPKWVVYFSGSAMVAWRSIQPPVPFGISSTRLICVSVTPVILPLFWPR